MKHIIEKCKEALGEFEAEHPQYNLLHASVGGAHLYGWAGKESDIDLRGYFAVPTEDYFRLRKPPTSIEFTCENGVDIQLQEIERFLALLISPNMNMIECALSDSEYWVGVPDTISQSIASLARNCLTKKVYPHIQGLVTHMKRHDNKYNFKNPKKPLYIIRELLRGVLLFEAGEYEPRITALKDRLLVGDELLVVDGLLRAKAEGALLDEKEIGESKKLVSALEGHMLRAKEFGILKVEPTVNTFLEADKILLKVRRAYL